MLSLAACRYRNVLAAHGGPVENVSSNRVWFGGRQMWQATAQLKAGLSSRPVRCVYSAADGTGLAETASVAAHIAISESMERWAYFETATSNANCERFGFSIDPTSNGMAAFPGLLARQARRAARLEGIERYAVLAWWEGHLDGYTIDTDWPGIRALVIPGEPGAFVAIAFKRNGDKIYSFGHGAEESIGGACHRAIVELERHERVVKAWQNKANLAAPTELLERRALFFSTAAGGHLFEQRLHRRAWASPAKWQLICDSEIPGAWSQYATVWRHAFVPPSAAFVQRRDDYFFW